jgi:hypothetical protein
MGTPFREGRCSTGLAGARLAGRSDNVNGARQSSTKD